MWMCKGLELGVERREAHDAGVEKAMGCTHVICFSTTFSARPNASTSCEVCVMGC